MALRWKLAAEGAELGMPDTKVPMLFIQRFA
jgi:hypothetical protein